MPKITVLKQPNAEACGPTAIKMTADYFKLPMSLKNIEEISLYKKRHGLTNKNLVETFQALNLKTKTKAQSSWNDLRKFNDKNSVIIVSWMLKGYLGHFSVVEKVTKDHIFLADPDAGKIIKLPRLVFMRLWFDYDDLWYPKTARDIQLRWLVVVKK